MKIVFRRCMTQRYRAILHLIDPIVDVGHKLVIVTSSDKAKLHKSYARPCDVGESSERTCRELAEIFGIEVKHFDKVKFTKKKHYSGDLSLTIDSTKYRGGNFLGIPYNNTFCYKDGIKIEVGNPMKDLIDEQIGGIDHRKAIILHPGGGRGIISPVRKDISDKRVIRNNINFLNKILSNLPSYINEVAIKPHPFPYKKCGAGSLKKDVIPNVDWDGKLIVRNSPLFSLLPNYNFIFNFGGTSALWANCINIKGLEKYPSKFSREKKIKERGGGVTVSELKYLEWDIQNSASEYLGTSVNKIVVKINEFTGV